MSYFNMVCDSCGREVYGCNIVNGMKFCAKCYQETFGETDKDKQIAELQKQLKSQPAEIVEKIKNYKGEYFEWKIGDKIYPAFKITEEDLDTILKEYKSRGRRYEIYR